MFAIRCLQTCLEHRHALQFLHKSRYLWIVETIFCILLLIEHDHLMTWQAFDTSLQHFTSNENKNCCALRKSSFYDTKLFILKYNDSMWCDVRWVKLLRLYHYGDICILMVISLQAHLVHPFVYIFKLHSPIVSEQNFCLDVSLF